MALYLSAIARGVTHGEAADRWVMATRKSNVIKFPQPIGPLLEKIDGSIMKGLRRDLATAEAGTAEDVEFLFLSIKRRLRDRDAIRRELEPTLHRSEVGHNLRAAFTAQLGRTWKCRAVACVHPRSVCGVIRTDL